jgi:hypothetical protein
MAFAPVYECSNCGDVWRIEYVDHIDIEYDEVYTEPHCKKCGNYVKEKFQDGVLVWHPLTEEEMLEESGFYNQEDK